MNRENRKYNGKEDQIRMVNNNKLVSYEIIKK